MTLAGITAAARAAKGKITDMRFMCVGKQRIAPTLHIYSIYSLFNLILLLLLFVFGPHIMRI